MPRSRYRNAYASGLVLLAFAGGEGPSHEARADEPEPRVRASMQCERAAEPGRVRCTVEAHAEGVEFAWADVVILSLPEFASALKGRIGPQDTTLHEAATYKWALALVARRAGQGEVRARVRVVTCEHGAPARKCQPSSVEVRAVVSVGG